MMANVGTLKELVVGVGDVVKFISHPDSLYLREEGLIHYVKKSDCGTLQAWDTGNDNTGKYWDEFSNAVFRIISRATPQPKLWRDMTAEEKGALLLARYEGKLIEYYTARANIWHKWNSYIFDDNGCGDFVNNVAYRVKPEPKVETVALCWRHDVGTVKNKIGTIDIIDGKPDCASIKMEKV